MRLGESNQQKADAEDEPRFIGIPERADGCHHRISFFGRCPMHQHANPEIVSVAQDVDEQRHPHQPDEDERKQFIEGHRHHANSPRP